jgi:hypothetical protein
MKNKFWLPCLALLGLAPCTGYGYDHQVSGVLVGFVRVAGNYGVSAFGRAGGSAFPGCANDSATMWADTSYLTADGQKALLATLLTARAMGTAVTVYYSTTSGYCRFQIVDIE